MSANPPKKIEQTSVINEKKPSTTTPPGPPQLCAKTSTGAHQRRISANSAHFFEKFGAPDLPPGIIGTMGRIGLVKVAVNFQKIAWIRCPYVLGSKRNSGVGVVLLLIFFFGVMCLMCLLCVYLIFGAMSVVFWSCGFTKQQMMVFVFVVLVAVVLDAVFFLGGRVQSYIVGSLKCFLWGGSIQKKIPTKIQKKVKNQKKLRKQTSPHLNFKKKHLIESFGNTKFLKHASLHPLPLPPQSLSTTWKSNCTKTSRCLR